MMQQNETIYRRLTDALKRANPNVKGEGFGSYGWAIGHVQYLVTGMTPRLYKLNYNTTGPIYDHLDHEKQQLFRELIEAGAKLFDSGCSIRDWEEKMKLEKQKILQTREALNLVDPPNPIDKLLLDMTAQTAHDLENGDVHLETKRVIYDLILASKLLGQGLSAKKVIEVLRTFRKTNVDTRPYSHESDYLYYVVDAVETEKFKYLVGCMKKNS